MKNPVQSEQSESEKLQDQLETIIPAEPVLPEFWDTFESKKWDDLGPLELLVHTRE